MHTKRKARAARLAAMLAMTIALTGCGAKAPAPVPEAGGIKSDDIKPGEGSQGAGAVIDIDTSDNIFQPVSGTDAVQPERDNTIMIYLVGTNLETDGQAASRDLIEMQESGVDTDTANVVVCTGGTRGWWLDISSDANGIYRVADGELAHEARTRKLSNMGDPGTLADFLDYSVTHYPAKNYTLIFWNHGLGPVQGFCYDEIYADMMEPAELKAALDASAFSSAARLSIVGFDACLMASFEMAKLLSPYADYMIASQEVESAYGWNFSFLDAYNDTPAQEEIAEEIVTRYAAFYEENRTSYFNPDVTLSVLDLSRVEEVSRAIDDLFSGMEKDLQNGAFRELSAVRAKTKGFGIAASGGTAESLDLVDMGDFAARMEEKYPAQAKALAEAVSSFVVHRVSNVSNACGVSLYYPFFNRVLFEHYGMEPLTGYDMPEGYLRYMRLFTDAWISGEIPGTEKEEEEDEVQTVFASFDRGQSTTDGVTLALTKEQIRLSDRIRYTVFYESDPGVLVPIVIHCDLAPDEEGNLFVPVTQPLFAAATDIDDSSIWPVMQMSADETRNVYQTLNTQMHNTYEFFPWGDVDNYNVTFAENSDGSLHIMDVERNEDVFDPETVAVHNGRETVDVGNWDYIAYTIRGYIETRDENGDILPFYEWERDTWTWTNFLQLDRTFRFESVPISELSEKKYVQILVRDVTGEIHASDLLELQDAAIPRTDVVTTPQGEMSFLVYEDHAMLQAYAGTDTQITIPQTVAGQPVTLIDAYVFDGNETITSVRIPDTVEIIGSGAFRGCTALEEVNIPQNLKTLEGDCFSRCKSLADITLPEGLEIIDVYALGHTAITSIHIPASVREIRAGAFADCEQLTTITTETEEYYKSVGNVLYTADGSVLVQYPEGLSDTIVITEGTKEILDYAFASNDVIRSVTYPATLEEIGEFAFYETPRLTDAFVFPESLMRIGAGAFYSFFSGSDADIDELAFGRNLTEIGKDAFSGRRIRAVTVDAANARYASVDGALTNKAKDLLLFVPAGIAGTYRIPDGIVSVNDNAFSVSSEIEELVVPDSVIYLGGYTIPGSRITIGAGVMEWKSVNSISYDEIVISEENPYFRVADGIIYDKDMTVLHRYPLSAGGTSYTVPEGVVTIASGAITNTDLQTLSLPSTLEEGIQTYYGSNNFFLLHDLRQINVAEGNTTYKSVNGIVYSADGTTLYVIPQQAGERVEIEEGVTHVAGSALYEISSTMEIYLPEGVTQIDHMITYITPPYDDDGSMHVELYIPASVETIDARMLGNEARDIARGEESVLTIHTPAGCTADRHFRAMGLKVVNDY
ncbi:MAG: leucine-rich repeat protein [Lachnospiraceae bacterium]|nr:leucine-rich repeat protein [Lachnospiraceae bacterium]